MSTKTTIKRIALVAVSALGLGMVSAVAPASATLLAPSSITVTDVTAVRAGVVDTMTVSFALPAGAAAADTYTVVARVISSPAASYSTYKAATPTVSGANSTAATSNSFAWQKAATGNGSYGTLTAPTYNTAGAAETNNWTTATTYALASGDSLTTGQLKLAFTPDAAGSYTIFIAVGTASNASYDTQAELLAASYANLAANLTSTSVVVATGGVPSTGTLTAVTTGAPKSGTYGALWKLTLADSAGVSASLGTGEVIKLTSNSTTVTFGDHTGTSLTNATLTGSNFINGVAYFSVQDSVAETVTITATGAGGSTLSAVSGTVSFTTTDAGAPSASIASTSTSLATGDTAGTDTTTTKYYKANTASTSYGIKVSGTASNVEYVTVTDTSGVFTGKAGAIYDKVITIDATLAYSTFTLTGTLLTGQSATVALASTTSTAAKTVVLTGRLAVATTVTPTPSVVRVATGSSNAISVNVKDQYGKNLAAQAVTVSSAGRNAVSSVSINPTDSLGNTSYTLADAGTTGTTDTVTFTAGSATGTTTIYYGSATAGTLTLEGPQTDLTVVKRTDKTDILASNTGASGTTATVTATVKDAAGIVLNGIPVVFTVSGTNCAILSTKGTVYTGAAGTAATSVYSWTNGSCVVTATGGGKTATDTVYFAQQTATEARTISATASGTGVIATVKDRFGNVVPGAYVWATRTGSGYFGNGTSTASAATDDNGQVEFLFNGTGTVTLALGSSTAADPEYGQSSSNAGYICSGAGCTQTVLSAYVAGTTITAETYVGSSIAPAGVNSVTVDVTGSSLSSDAIDAANEATDAANAATDAANAAAEAADAATAAAQDAQAAVAELATQVAALIAGIKAQITTLTNLVIKIQKKVKA